MDNQEILKTKTDKVDQKPALIMYLACVAGFRDAWC